MAWQVAQLCLSSAPSPAPFSLFPNTSYTLGSIIARLPQRHVSILFSHSTASPLLKNPPLTHPLRLSLPSFLSQDLGSLRHTSIFAASCIHCCYAFPRLCIPPFIRCLLFPHVDGSEGSSWGLSHLLCRLQSLAPGRCSADVCRMNECTGKGI